ncbi:serpin B6-like isoform X1 [Patiria miniata]|uniref:Serpin domain-containing protein n=1 Tax=Patiria miniata TaxID=46514 RepID=A0A913ZGU4_PATMI|nr:serpin B6-like isoform X1 [Patiria miniata]
MASKHPQDVRLAQTAAKASNTFASNLFRVLTEGGSSNNIFFSPMSISTALAMTFMGARGETASQMSQVLHFNILEESVLHQSFADLSALIFRADAPYTLKAANRLFGHKGLDVLANFVDDSKKYYGASMETLDFIGDGEGSRQHINSWVEKQTANRIKDLLAAGSIDALTRLVLVNAIYFKGDWAAKFQVSKTSPEKFHISATEDFDVPMMHQRGKFNFGRDDSVSSSILELPYLKNEVSMFIVLPDQVDGLVDVQKKLSQEMIDSWVTEARMRDSPTVIVSLPKFTLEQDFVLNDVLRKMGMSDPFDAGKADFSGMTGDKDLFISKVIHKAFLDVNEEGSEAAAATAVVMQAPTSCMPARTLEFKADHPFLVFICDNKTGAILFIGQLCKPEGDTIMGDSPSEKGMGSGGNVLGNTCLCPPPPPPLPCP